MEEVRGTIIVIRLGVGQLESAMDLMMMMMIVIRLVGGQLESAKRICKKSKALIGPVQNRWV